MMGRKKLTIGRESSAVSLPASFFGVITFHAGFSFKSFSIAQTANHEVVAAARILRQPPVMKLL